MLRLHPMRPTAHHSRGDGGKPGDDGCRGQATARAMPQGHVLPRREVAQQGASADGIPSRSPPFPTFCALFLSHNLFSMAFYSTRSANATNAYLVRGSVLRYPPPRLEPSLWPLTLLTQQTPWPPPRLQPSLWPLTLLTQQTPWPVSTPTQHQIATATAEGTSISEPTSLETNWDIADFVHGYE